MRKVEVSITIKTTPALVIGAFTDSDMLRGWWNVERSLIEKKVGGMYALAWNISEKGFGFVSTGTIGDFRPNERLVVDNFVYMNPERALLGPMRLIIEARQLDETKTQVYICQDGYQQGEHWDWYYEAVRQAWPIVSETLKAYLERR